MASTPLSVEDLGQISDQGLTPDRIFEQLERFAQGVHYAPLARPCRVGDGILRLQPEDLQAYAEWGEPAVASGRAAKFVPASGAGSRMFQSFLRGLHEGVDASLAEELRGLARYPFFSALCESMAASGLSLEECLRREDYRVVLEFLLTPRGLNYAALPKGMIPFHAYRDFSRTALEEQIVEGLSYLRDEKGVSRFHFTVSQEHETAIREFLKSVLPRYKVGGARIELSFSIQANSTDTVAADLQNGPFRDRQGRLLFRPAGHGALLQNLNAVGGDLVFIKNIDNVAPDSKKAATILYKRAMLGVLVELQEECFAYLRQLEMPSLSFEELEEIEGFFTGELSGTLSPDWEKRGADSRKSWLFEGLNRPLRVCGMVPNQGEPGGAPFWVEKPEGGFSLQIVESVQVDPKDTKRQQVFRASTHFNPVDLICGLRDYRGKPFDLNAFSDPKAGFITEKSHEGLPLKALELPGLWNGAMARWNTIFLEVPASTFTPVKRVEDLLRPEHRP